MQKYTCPHCGAVDLDYGQAYCHRCGRRLNWGTPLLDGDTVDRWLARYPSRWREDVPPLDRLGQDISGRRPRHATRAEIAQFVSWKRPATGAKFLAQNIESQVERVTERAFAETRDIDRVRLLTSLEQVGVPMASAILRFVFPDRYGTVDWRNWYVLSHARNSKGKPNELVGGPLLPRIASVERLSSIGTTPQHYLKYLGLLRDLAAGCPRTRAAGSIQVLRTLERRCTERTPAEIDMAIFSYSWSFI